MYKLKITFADIKPWTVSKRYSELFKIHASKEFKSCAKVFPPKSLFTLNEKQMEKRKLAIQQWFDTVLALFTCNDAVLACKPLVILLDMAKHVPQLLDSKELLSASNVVLLKKSASVAQLDKKVNNNAVINDDDDNMNLRSLGGLRRSQSSNVCRKSSFAMPKKPAIQKDMEQQQQDMFEHLLNDEMCRKEFKLFCQQECSTENIACYELCQKYSQCSDTLEQQALGKQLCDHYLRASSIKEINLPVQKRFAYIAMFERALQEQAELGMPYLDKKLFDSLAKDVKMVMSDTYQRYLKHANKLI